MIEASHTIEKGSTILVTGVNGFIASHVADQLLADGYRVRGTVRHITKGGAVSQHFKSTYGEDRFELAIISDITEAQAFDRTVEGVSGIVHLATAATFSTDPNEVIPPTVAGALSIFATALLQRSIRSIVYTSDSFAALLPQPNQLINVIASTYNEASVAVERGSVRADEIRKAAWDPSTAYELNVYAAAKVAAERAIWQFVEDHMPCFQVSAILANVNIGASVDELPLSSTATFVPKLLAGDTSGLFFPAQHFINVRDCARLHVAALLDSSQHKERIFAMAAPFNWNDVLGILRRLRPDAKIIDDMPNLGRDLSTVPNEAAEKLLKRHYGHGWTILEESVRQNIASL